MTESHCASANRPAFNAITRQENGTIRVEEKSKGRRTLAPKQQNSRISLEGVPKRIRINQSKRHVRRSV
ncbi:Long-chain-fatty-acid--CoA ligase [Trichinella pseudospiralis]